MAFDFSKKILLITNNNRATPPIKHALNKFRLEIADKYINLNSISIIKKGIKQTKKTTFLRTELFKFIKEEGYPYIIALDARTDTGLGDELDPDKMKILRTFLISYIILSRGQDFSNLQGNILILTDDDNFSKKYYLETNPHQILNIIKTNDTKINSFIDELKEEPEKFNKLFFIKAINPKIASSEITLNIENYISGIIARQKLRKDKDKKPAFDSTNQPPAKVVYKIDDTEIYVDGEIISSETDEYKSLEKEEFYIIGHWTNKTQGEVTKKLQSAIVTGISDTIKFNQEDNINLNIGDLSIIDAVTASTLIQLFLKNLDSYKNIKIFVNPKNEEILKNSQGFSLIKKLVKTVNSQ